MKTLQSVNNVVGISELVQESVAGKVARTHTHTHVNTVISCDVTLRRPSAADDNLNLYRHENIIFYEAINYWSHTVTAAVMAAGTARIICC
jgi:hypothetical protein